MPKYEYACKSCGERLEVVQSFADDPLTECPACGGVLRKVFSAPSIAFKGSGFYRTDNRKRRGSEPSESKADKSTSDSPSSDGSSDSKAPAAADGKSEPAKADAAPKADAPAKADSSAKSKAAEAKSA
jgi:putative FmdB family regulatory protein